MFESTHSVHDPQRLHAVVGHSCGGVVGVALLAIDAARAERLALIAAPYLSPRFPVRKELLTSPRDRLILAWTPLAHLVHLTSSVFWPLLRRLPVPDYLAGAWVGSTEHTISSYVGTAQECLFRADLDPLLPGLQDCPPLLLYGQQDPTVPLSHGQRLHAALPNSQLNLLRDGHYAVLDKVLANVTLLAGGLGAAKPPLRTSPTVKLIAAKRNLVLHEGRTTLVDRIRLGLGIVGGLCYIAMRWQCASQYQSMRG